MTNVHTHVLTPKTRQKQQTEAMTTQCVPQPTSSASSSPICSTVRFHARAKAATAEDNSRSWGTQPAWIWQGIWTEQGSPFLVVTGCPIRSDLEFWLVLGPRLHAPQSESSPHSGPLAPQDSSPLGQRLPLLRNVHKCGGQGRFKPSTAPKQGNTTHFQGSQQPERTSSL